MGTTDENTRRKRLRDPFVFFWSLLYCITSGGLDGGRSSGWLIKCAFLSVAWAGGMRMGHSTVSLSLSVCLCVHYGRL